MFEDLSFFPVIFVTPNCGPVERTSIWTAIIFDGLGVPVRGEENDNESGGVEGGEGKELQQPDSNKIKIW